MELIALPLVGVELNYVSFKKNKITFLSFAYYPLTRSRQDFGLNGNRVLFNYLTRLLMLKIYFSPCFVVLNTHLMLFLKMRFLINVQLGFLACKFRNYFVGKNGKLIFWKKNAEITVFLMEKSENFRLLKNFFKIQNGRGTSHVC